MDTRKIPIKVLRKFYKEFALGNQYIEIDPIGRIVEIPKQYYWQEREVYNRVITYVQLLKSKKISDNLIYGRDGFVSRVFDFQVAYNKVKNNALTILNRYTYPIACVEDGSVDLDALEEEGLAPGKVLIYRNGAQTPKLDPDFGKVDIISSIAYYEEHLEDEMYKIYTRFLDEVGNGN